MFSLLFSPETGAQRYWNYPEERGGGTVRKHQNRDSLNPLGALFALVKSRAIPDMIRVQEHQVSSGPDCDAPSMMIDTHPLGRSGGQVGDHLDHRHGRQFPRIVAWNFSSIRYMSVSGEGETYPKIAGMCHMPLCQCLHTPNQKLKNRKLDRFNSL